jgi:hypothetical protein
MIVQPACKAERLKSACRAEPDGRVQESACRAVQLSDAKAVHCSGLGGDQPCGFGRRRCRRRNSRALRRSDRSRRMDDAMKTDPGDAADETGNVVPERQIRICPACGAAIRIARERKASSVERLAEASYAEYRRQKADASGAHDFRLPLC